MGSENAVGWTPSPNRRGTIDILWICAFTLFICTWTVLHPNIPTQEEVRAQWTQWPFWRKRLKPAGLLLLTVAAPELVVALAVRDWLWARASIREMRDLGFDDWQWSMSHAFFANMGGFVLYFPVQDREEGVTRKITDSKRSDERPESVRQDVVQREGLVQRTLCATQLAMLIRKPLRPTPSSIDQGRLAGSEQNRTRSPSSSPVCKPAGWSFQCFTRAHQQHLAVSQREVATTGLRGLHSDHVTCSGGTSLEMLSLRSPCIVRTNSATWSLS